MSAGTVEKTNDALIDTIVTYDKAETADAYGEINMLTASSFCGMAGQVWGYDLARHDDITSGKSQPLFTEKQFDGSELKVFDAAPLLDAGIELFGTENNRRYHPIPGAHTISRQQGRHRLPTEGGPPAQGRRGLRHLVVHRHLAVPPTATSRPTCSSRTPVYGPRSDNEDDMMAFLEQHRKEIVWSVVECGRDSNVLFDRTYVGFAHRMMKPGEIGNAITVGPYVTLARNAVPTTGFTSLNDLNLSDWLKEMDFESLTNLAK